MNGKPVKAQFVKLPRDLLASSAWRTLGINERRVLDYLMLEDMRRAGRHNGNLTAPHRELVKAGIGGQYVAGAIRRLEDCGLIRRKHHDAYSPDTYALTWLPCQGTPPTNDWRRASGASSVPYKGAARGAAESKLQRCSTTALQRCSTEGDGADSRVVQFQGVAGSVPYKGAAVYRQSYQGRELSKIDRDRDTGATEPPDGPAANPLRGAGGR